MSFPISVSRLAVVLPAPAANVAVLWPRIEQCMDALGCGSDLAKVAALATIHVEDPDFRADRCEKFNGDPHVYFAKYDGRADLGNREPGDGYRFRGRGPSQLTGRDGYAWVGKLIGCDLVANPDLALETDRAAFIFAAFFREKGLAHLAEQKDWARVRRRWNGGLNGYEEFLQCVTRLLVELESAKSKETIVCAAGV